MTQMLTAEVGLVFRVNDNNPDGPDADLIVDTIHRAMTAFKDQVGADSVYLEDVYAIDDGIQTQINKE